MKVYAIIVTIVAVLALGTVGFEFWQGAKVKKAFTQKSDELSSTQAKLEGIEEQYKRPAENINNFSQILGKSSSSFIQPGVMKIDSFNQQAVDEINKQMATIQDASVQDEMKSNWDKFVASKTINDYRTFITTISNVILRSSKYSQLSSIFSITRIAPI